VNLSNTESPCEYGRHEVGGSLGRSGNFLFELHSVQEVIPRFAFDQFEHTMIRFKSIRDCN
jgi:hypothetical protein